MKVASIRHSIPKASGDTRRLKELACEIQKFCGRISADEPIRSADRALWLIVFAERMAALLRGTVGGRAAKAIRDEVNRPLKRFRAAMEQTIEPRCHTIKTGLKRGLRRRVDDAHTQAVRDVQGALGHALAMLSEMASALPGLADGGGRPAPKRRKRSDRSKADQVRERLSGKSPYEGTKSELASEVGYTHPAALARVKNFDNLWSENERKLAVQRAESRKRMAAPR